VLNRDGIAPPGPRWAGRTARQAATWSYTTITAHRSLRKGILHNPLYIGKQVWNRSQWLRHPVTRRETYRLRSASEWIERDVPELRIVPQDLWDRARARVAAYRTGGTRIEKAQHRYLLSGFVKCATCGWNYIISTRHSYRCGTFKGRGPVACSNSLAVSRRRLEATVLAALRNQLYTEERVREITGQVRAALVERGRRHAAEMATLDRAKERRQIEREIEGIKKAVCLGKATSTLLEMLEDKERRLSALAEVTDRANGDAVPDCLSRVLDRLPELVRERFSNLEALLADKQIERGKQILAAFDTKVLLHPCGDHLEVEIKGRVEGIFTLLGSTEGQKRWLGEEDSNPR
jgi:site-specific DNA recombinase